MKRDKKPWVIFFADFIPCPIDNGQNVHICEMAKWLRKKFRVGLFVPRRLNEEELQRDISGVFDRLWQGGRVPAPASWHWRLRPLWNRARDRLAERVYRRHYGSRIDPLLDNPFVRTGPNSVFSFDRVCRRIRPVAVISEYVWSAVPSLVVARRYGALSVIDTITVFRRHHEREREANVPRELWATKKEFTEQDEKELHALSDVLIAIQVDEEAVLREDFPEKTVVLSGCSFEMDRLSEANQREHVILFVSGTATFNVHAIEAFLRSEWPKVVESQPEAELHICGRIDEKIDPVLREQEGVVLHGYCEDLRPYYEQATLVLNPLLYGSGLKIKSVEAMAHGRCLVSTPLGVETLEAYSGEAFAVAEMEDLAGQIITLLRDPDGRKKMEARAFEIAQEAFNPEANYEELSQVIQRHCRAT